MNTDRLVFASAFCLALLSPPSKTQAQPAHDPLTAEALYKRGRELIASGNWAEGCEKFDASMKLNPAAVTMINIAKCHEHDGKLTLALSDYRAALKLNEGTLGEERQKQLAEIVKAGIAEITPRLAKLVIVMASPPPGLVLVRDQTEMPAAVLGERILVDPGTHEIEASAPGYVREKRTVTVKEAEEAQVEIALAKEKAAPPPENKKPALEKPVVVNPIVNKKDTDELNEKGGTPVWAWAAGGAGVALVAAGIAFRVDQSAAESMLIEKCGEELKCPASGGYDPSADNARKNRDFGLFVGLSAAGALALGVAVYGFVRGSGKQAPKNSMVLPVITDSFQGAVVHSHF